MKREDIKTLVDLGYGLDAINDINENKEFCKFVLERKKPFGQTRISAVQARGLLGDRAFLSGLAKSCLGKRDSFIAEREVSADTIGRFKVRFNCESAFYVDDGWNYIKQTLDKKTVEDLIMLNNLYREYSDLDKEFSAECKENLESPYIEELAREIDRIGLEIKKIEDRYANAA